MKPFVIALQERTVEARKQKERDAAEAYRTQSAQAGPHPITNPEVLKEAIAYLEKAIERAADDGQDQTLVPYLDVPGFAERQAMINKEYPLLAKMGEIRRAAEHLQNAFVEAHPDFVPQSISGARGVGSIYLHAGSFKITWW